MPIPEFSFIHHIRRLLYLWQKFLGIFGSNCTNWTTIGHFVVSGVAK
jgi:hypothetical protein